MRFWVLFGLALTVYYLVACCWWPFRDCWVCDGRGHHRNKNNRKLSRPCRWCHKSGKRLRLGRRLVNWIIRRRRQGAVKPRP